MHHLSSRFATRKMVNSTLDKTPASPRTRTSKMAEKVPCTIPLRAFFGHFLGSRSPRCGSLIKRAMHHLSSHEAGRKMLHRTPYETPYTSSLRYPKMAVFDQIAFFEYLRSENLRIRDLRILDPDRSSSSSAMKGSQVVIKASSF